MNILWIPIGHSWPFDFPPISCKGYDWVANCELLNAMIACTGFQHTLYQNEPITGGHEFSCKWVQDVAGLKLSPFKLDPQGLTGVGKLQGYGTMVFSSSVEAHLEPPRNDLCDSAFQDFGHWFDGGSACSNSCEYIMWGGAISQAASAQTFFKWFGACSEAFANGIQVQLDGWSSWNASSDMFGRTS